MSCRDIVICSFCCIDVYQAFICVLFDISHYILNILVVLIQFDIVNDLLFSFLEIGGCHAIARYINQTYERTGALWEGRYKST